MSRRGPNRRAIVALATIALGLAGAGAQAGEQAELIFVEAENLLRVGRVDQARQRYESIVAGFPAPDYPDLIWRAAARVRLGDIHYRGNEVALAGGEYVAVLEQEPPSAWTSRARLGLAAVVLGQGEWKSAADMLQRIVTAADAGSLDADGHAANEASRRLALIDRFHLQPLLGRDLWSSSHSLSLAGLRLDNPVAVAAAGDGQLLLVDEGIPTVLLIDATQRNVSRLNYNEHGRPWWGPDGLPYLPTRKAGVIALGGGRLGFLAEEGGRPVQLKDVRGGGRTPAGDWYLLDYSPRRVLRFGPEGGYKGRVSREVEQPVDLSVDGLGRLHYLDRGAGAVVRFGPDGEREGTVVKSQWRRPEALEIDALGNIYVLDRDGRTVDVYDAEGSRLAQLGPRLPSGVELRSPRDITVDGQGRLYIVDRSASAVHVVQ